MNYLQPSINQPTVSEENKKSSTLKRKRYLVLVHVFYVVIIDPVTFTLNKNGKYFLAKYHNSSVQDFSKQMSRGIRTTGSSMPGPGAYDVTK